VSRCAPRAVEPSHRKAYADCVVRDVGGGSRHTKIKQNLVPVKNRFEKYFSWLMSVVGVCDSITGIRLPYYRSVSAI